MNCPKVMLDTNILKFAAVKLERLIRVNKPTRNDKGEVTGVMLYEPGYINPNEAITNPELRREADLLPRVAELATISRLCLLLDREVEHESWGVPKMNSVTGLFFDAPITEAEPPLDYERVLFGGGMKAKEWAEQFLRGIQHERFKTLAKIVGAHQGENKPNLNQLRDAYYIWSAEHNNCDFLLTMDFKLIRMIERDKKHCIKVNLVKPSQLLEQMVELIETQ